MDSDNLFIGLESPQSDERVSALRLIRQTPGEALKVCSDSGKDLVGKLLELCELFTNSVERWEFVFTTLGYADERTAKLALDVFVSSVDNRFMVMAANRINKMSAKDKAVFLPPILLADNNRNRTRLCANLLAGNGMIDTKTSIRVCAVSDKECTLPCFSRATADIWVEELQGPYMQSVRRKFLKLNDDPSDILLTKWDGMSDGLKTWLLNEIISVNSARFDVLINAILQTENSAIVVLAALNCVLGHSIPNPFRSAVSALIRHENEDVRAKAVLCCEDAELLNTILGYEKSAQVVANIIIKLAESTDDVQFFSDYFSDKRWQVRAVTAQVMVMLAPKSIPALQELFHSDDVNTRTSAIKCLCDLDMQDWVETSLK